MNKRYPTIRALTVLLPLALCARMAGGTTIQELVRLKGHERNTLVGLGIVVGLDGTGDESDDSLVAARPYEQFLANLGNPIASIDELAAADAYAIVQITMQLPATGSRSGDELDVTVSTLFNASSLAGGQLVVSPLRVPLPDQLNRPPIAFATGDVIIEGDNPRRGLVRRGGQMVRDVRTNPMTAAGTIELVLDDAYAGYPVANTLTGVINDEFALDGFQNLAVVEDAKNIRVTVPLPHRGQPASFLATLLTVRVDPSLLQSGARVVINEQKGTITVTGDVQVGPVIITHKLLSITNITPPPQPTAQMPEVTEQRWAELNTTAPGERIATRLSDLLNAFDQLSVPVEDQIALVFEIKKSGKLYADLVLE